jgi:hypothetical protein
MHLFYVVGVLCGVMLLCAVCHKQTTSSVCEMIVVVYEATAVQYQHNV